ncbi:hypothetical protein MKX03_020362 [Papaver bracteatum]|nr:hypothetical protein MKX03_020362 [Papaver bracteatum]
MAPKRRRVSKSNTKNNDEISSSSRLNCKTVKGFHEFKIEGYSLVKGIGVGEYMTSAEFSIGGHHWVIVFYPDGFKFNEDGEDYISVYLKLVSPREARATFEFKLLDQTGKGKHGVRYIHKSPKTFNTEANDWGWPEYMKRSKLETSSYLRNDCLSIHCTVGVLQTHVEDEKHCVIPVPPSDMSQKLKSLLESNLGFERVGSESFKAHKSILAARSPVFRAMFFGLAGNPNMETVSIEDVDPFVFKAMLLFLYSDELPEAATTTQHLFDVADRFDLAQLKLICEAKLSEEITTDTVASTLVLAHQHQCLQLKTACLNFAAKAENVGEVMKSDGFADLAKSSPSLLIDLFETSAVVNIN